ncbi:MAG TPA: HdeA/HdeB family chaperone [Xanthobacteraceae bacterium]
MRIRISLLHPLLLALILVFGARTWPASAQVMLYMSMATCGQYLNSDPERRDEIAAWMSGYVSAAKGQNTVDIARFALNRKLIDKYCAKHRSEALMSAIQGNAW